jgi:hypothetical protein
MKTQVQSALMIAAVLFLVWALSLVIKPDATQALLSTSPRDPALTALFATALFAFAAVFLIASGQATRELVYASAVSLALLAIVLAYQMLIAKHTPQGAVVVFTLVVTAAVAAFLFISVTEAATRLAAKKGSGRRASGRGRRAKRRRR